VRGGSVRARRKFDPRVPADSTRGRHSDAVRTLAFGVIAYHGTKSLSTVLRDGLRVPPYEGWGCRIGHVCIAETPEIAAAFALGPDAGIVTVKLDGLDLPEEGFHGGEMRLHEDVPPERLELFTEPVIGSLEGHADPAATTSEGQHPTCIRLLVERGLRPAE
jgi:hypothetical protein